VDDDGIVEVRLPNGETALVRARQVDGGGATKTSRGRLDLESVSRTLEGVSEAVQAGLVKAAPSKVSVELAMEFAVKAGVLTALIVDGESKGSLTVTLEWERGAGTEG
jgi:Trypsin-co-occurring domain 1